MSGEKVFEGVPGITSFEVVFRSVRKMGNTLNVVIPRTVCHICLSTRGATPSSFAPGYYNIAPSGLNTNVNQ